MDSTVSELTRPAKRREALHQVEADSAGVPSKPKAGKGASKPAAGDDAELNALLAKAARKLIRTHGESGKLRALLKDAKSEWNKALSASRSAMKSALRDAHKEVDPSRDTPSEIAAVAQITAAASSQQQAAEKKVEFHHEAGRHKASIVETIEGTPPGNCKALQMLGAAHQLLEETKAGRKAALHAILLDLEESEARGRKQMDGALQLSLFE